MKKTPLIIVNGQLGDNVSALDRGLAYGDGIFETMQVTNGDVFLWQYHYDRLNKGLQRLGITLDREYLNHHLQLTLKHIGSLHGVLKLLITRGEGGRGYCPPEMEQVNVISIFSLVPKALIDENNDCQNNGVDVHYCKEILPINRSIAGIKTLNQLVYVLASKERQQLTAKEGLLFTEAGHLVEATARNIFIVKDDKIFTPPIDECGVSGVMRHLIIDQIPLVSEMPILKSDLLQADEVFLTNSISHIWPVVKSDDSSWPVGKKTQEIQEKVRQFLNEKTSLSLSQYLSHLK